MDTKTAPERRKIAPGETTGPRVYFGLQLRDGETLTGTPTISDHSSSEVVSSSPAVNNADLEVEVNGQIKKKPSGTVVTFTATAAATLNETQYEFLITVSTTAGRTLPRRVIFERELVTVN